MADGTIFALPEYKQFRSAWDARRTELKRRRRYYDGTMYSELTDALGWLAPRLGKEIKPLFLPLARAVDVDAGIIPGGWTLGDEEISETVVQSWTEAQAFLFKASGWQTRGVLYVHYGAQYGVVGLRTVLSKQNDVVKLGTVDPLRFMLIYEGGTPLDREDLPVMSISAKTLKVDGKRVEFAEVITRDLIRTYLGGVPWASDGEVEWQNELEEVPYIEVRHIETGDMLGESTYAKAMPLLDEVNHHATALSKIIKDHAEPQWAVIGAAATDLSHSGDNIWFIPEGGDVRIILPQVDIPGMLEFIREIKDGVKEALPELSFDELRTQKQIAAETLSIQLIELVLKIQRTRPNYDQGLVQAMQMCGRAGKIAGISEIVPLDDPDLAMDENREILPLDPLTRINIEMQELALERMQMVPIELGEVAEDAPVVQGAIEESPDNIESTMGLNGAQINAAKDLLSEVSTRQVDSSVAEELLIALGMQPERAKRMVAAAVSFTPQGEEIAGS